MKGFGGMQQLMKQANQLQNRMKKLQEEFAEKEFSATSGGGAVEVIVSGSNLVKAVKINKDVMEAGDVDMLQDMVVSATNEALKTSKDEYQKASDKITGGMNIPGM